MSVVVLSGGVGGARFVCGLVDAVPPAEVTVIGNVGDDVEVLGLHVSPDLDSILYALAGLADEDRGWGRADETWNALASAEAFGGESWFKLGDLDIGLHLVRTQLLREGGISSATILLTDQSYGPGPQAHAPYRYQKRVVWVSGEAMALAQEAGWFYQSQDGNRAEANLRAFDQLRRQEVHWQILDWQDHEGWNETR